MLTLIFKDTTIEGLRKQVVDAGAAFINFKIGNGSADVRMAAPKPIEPKPVEPPPGVMRAVEEKIENKSELTPPKTTGAKRGPKPKNQATEMKAETLTPPAAVESAPLQNAQVETPPAAVETNSPEVQFTKEDAIKALTAVNEKFGMDAARACLLRFGVNRLGELKANQFNDFVNRCNLEAAKK